MSEDIRKMINKVKNFKLFLNERFEISNIPSNIVLLSILKNNSTEFMLFDKLTKKPIGYISFYLYPKINSFTVGGAYSERGYGAFLYECAMTFVYPTGLSMSRDSTISDDALNVWRKFETRNDVKKERMYSDEITHKKEDWLESDFLGDNPEYRQKIFDLEDTRFFYNFGKEKLNKLIEVGRKYMSNNNISEEDIEYMSWDLEK
jgi:hypothetical protein